MIKIDIISGFLGAGKTTLINKLIKEVYSGEKIVLIENEFGEIGIDSGFLKDTGIQISEMNSGCICCTLVGDFSKALKQVADEYSPDRILIEPSGVGKLSDVIRAVESAEIHDAKLNSAITVVDVNKCKMYMKNFGEFFNDQISNAACIIFSHTDKTTDAKIEEALSLVRVHNKNANIITTPVLKLNAETLLDAIIGTSSLSNHLSRLIEEDSCPICGHHHDHEHHEHHEHEHCDHEHHEHEHCDHEHHEHEHCDHEHHEHEHCDHDHHEHHHHHHHADDVFTSWGRETVKKFTENEIKATLEMFADSEKFGTILRAKGIVQGTDDKWIYFDYVPGEVDVRVGSADNIGKICVIGANINEDAIAIAFGI